MRYLFPYLVSIFIRRVHNKMTGGINKKPATKNRKKEGDVSIDYTPKKTAKRSKGSEGDIGDYVDFEEVDE